MSKYSSVPIVFMAFADSEAQGYLPELRTESNELFDLLLPLKKTGQIDLLREYHVDNETIPKRLTDFHNQIFIFHYGGHADGKHLMFNDQKGHSQGLNELLGLQKSLRVVFLNGCETQEQAMQYVESGIPVVIATTQTVKDADALYFATSFYRALANRHNLQEAFKTASGALKLKSRLYSEHDQEEIVVIRGFSLRKDFGDEIPWRMYVNESRKEVLNWCLPETVTDEHKITYVLADSETYQKIRKRIVELEAQIQAKQEQLKAFPDPLPGALLSVKNSIDEERRLLGGDLAQAREEEEQLKKQVIELANAFSRIEINTDRLRLAKQRFEKGEFAEARAVLDAETMGQELDVLLQEKEQLQMRAEENEARLKDKAGEFFILARLTALDFDLEGRMEKAMRYFEKSLEAWQDVENIFAFAFFLQEQNQDLKALPLYAEALEIYQRLFQTNPDRFEPDVAMTQNNLGTLFSNLHAYDKAKKAYVEALEIYQRLSQTNPDRFEPYVAITQHNLGAMFSNLHAYDKAKKAYVEALEIYQRLSQTNPDHFEQYVAKTQNNLGLMYSDLNAYDKAENAYVEALEIYQRLSQTNPDHFEQYVAKTQNNLGFLFYDLHAYDKAEKAYVEALEIYQRLFQTNPDRFEPDVANTQNNLGLLYRNLNSYDKAEKAYAEALEIYQRLSQTNPDRFEIGVAITQNNLGLMYSALDAYDKAEKAYVESLEIKKRLSQTNPDRFETDVAETQNNLGIMYSALDAYDKAEKAYVEALEIYQRLSQTNPDRFEPYAATTQYNLGNMYSNLNAYDKAEKAYVEALEIYQRLSQTNPDRFEPDVATTQYNLGLMYSALHAYDKAEKAYVEALEIYQRLSQTNPDRFEPDVAMTQNNLGTLFYNLHAYDKAEKAYVEALEIHQRLSQTSLDRYEPDVAMTQNNLGIMYSDLHAYDKAEKAYVEALEIRKRLSQTNPDRYNPEVAGLFGTLSWLFLLAKKFSKAEESAIQGLKWDPSQEWINTNLAHAILFQGRYEEAEALYSTLKSRPFNDTTTFGETFLQDLKTLEEKGITHPDVERIRTLLL